MVFHIVGAACIAMTMHSGVQRDQSGHHVKPVCQQLLSAKDYASYAECWTALKDPAQIPLLPAPQVVFDGSTQPFSWYPPTGPGCIQEPGG